MQILKKSLTLLLFLSLIIPGVSAADFSIAEPTLMGGIVLGVIMLGAIFAFLGMQTSEDHPFLRLFFFFLSLLAMTISVNIMYVSCSTFMGSVGICELVGAYSNNMTYVLMYVPIVYFLVYFIYTIFTSLKQRKQADLYQSKY